MKFNFNKKRVRVLTNSDEVAPNCKGIVYWMFRDGRVQGLFEESVNFSYYDFSE